MRKTYQNQDVDTSLPALPDTVNLAVAELAGELREGLLALALGIDGDGVKHPLALVEGSTENTTLVTDLLVGLRERGLDVTRPILAVIDGSKALACAVRDVFDHPVLQRCQLHYADLRIMPMWSLIPLQGSGFVLARSA